MSCDVICGADEKMVWSSLGLDQNLYRGEKG